VHASMVHQRSRTPIASPGTPCPLGPMAHNGPEKACPDACQAPDSMCHRIAKIV